MTQEQIKSQKELITLGDVVFPLVKIKSEGAEAHITEFKGTGFFIGTTGYFLTAKHVISQTLHSSLKENERLVALPLVNEDERRIQKVIQIENVEDGPNGWDISIGKTSFVPKPFFSITDDSEVYGWNDVHSFGFPEYSTHDDAGKYLFLPNFLKGYVQNRIVRDSGFGPLKDALGYLISYPIPKGMSGSPVFQTGPKHSLVGVGLGSYETITVIWEAGEYKSPQENYKENTKRVIEIGIAINIYALKDWKPKICNGTALSDLR